jgi:hypothetical protein
MFPGNGLGANNQDICCVRQNTRLFAPILFAVGFNTPQLAAVKLWQRLEFMVVNPTRTKNFLYKKNPPLLAAGIFY